MKKILTSLVAGLMISVQAAAFSAHEVCGRFDGDLNIAGTMYPGKTVYLLPGVLDSTVTFVLPDFMFNAGKLGNIVLPNIPMDAKGQLSLENATLYLDSIAERATITVVNGLEDEGVTYNSIVTDREAMVLLSIAAPSLPEPILVLFAGAKVTDKNYALFNGGFEGEWTDNEPEGWHSFGSATGLMADFVTGNTYQFVPSNQTRPGSEGQSSAMLSSDILFGVKANGNCTNGQINAGSMTADDAENNYNFSDPKNTGFNTPFHGRPDSIVFWAMYLPADRDASNEANKARMNAVITTDARYQDPETAAYSEAKIAEAAINYAAAAGMEWQRLAVPFVYSGTAQTNLPAYLLTTFTTNMTPGGGSSYTTGGALSKKNVLDTVYIDDVEMVYRKQLSAFSMDDDALVFTNRIASSDHNYCDDCAAFVAQAEGQSAQPFIAFDAVHKCIFVYVIADDYAQSGDYNLYRVEFADSETGDLPSQDQTEGLNDIPSASRTAEKIILNGQLLLLKDGKTYNILGTPVE